MVKVGESIKAKLPVDEMSKLKMWHDANAERSIKNWFI